MGASNWANCPKCTEKVRQEQLERENAFAKSYGKVSEEEYERLREHMNQPQAERNTSLREDYQLGVTEEDDEDPVFYVEYSGHCSECGFEHKFRHQEKLPLAKSHGDD